MGEFHAGSDGIQVKECTHACRCNWPRHLLKSLPRQEICGEKAVRLDGDRTHTLRFRRPSIYLERWISLPFGCRFRFLSRISRQMKTTAFSVKPYHDSKRPKLKFVATGPVIHGKRWRRFFETKGEAEAFLQQKKVERENHGARALEFPEALRIMAAEAAATLEPFGWTLRDAVAFCLPHLQAKHRSCSIEHAKDALLAAKQKDGASRRYLEDLRSRLGQMAAAFPGKPLAEFTVANVDDWLRGLPVAALTRNHFRRVASCMFAFGVERGYCAGNRRRLKRWKAR